jgi:hypothetical protein
MEFPIVKPDPEFQLHLIRSTDDPALSSPDYQKELLDFCQALKSKGVEASARHWAHDAVGGGGGLTGELTLMVTALAPVITAVAGVAGAWLRARYGRKVRVKLGDTEVEARTVEEVENALRLIDETQERNRTREIRRERPAEGKRKETGGLGGHAPRKPPHRGRGPSQ